MIFQTQGDYKDNMTELVRNYRFRHDIPPIGKKSPRDTILVENFLEAWKNKPSIQFTDYMRNHFKK